MGSKIYFEVAIIPPQAEASTIIKSLQSTDE
jgi:hypothetical protein